MIELTTLGRCQIHRDGVELAEFPSLKQKCALLIYLAIEGPVSRDHLLALFWPEREEEKARHSLSQALYALRQELSEDLVEVRADQIGVAIESMEVDAKRLEAAANQGDWEAVTRLYEGPFLDQFPLRNLPGLEDWCSRTRGRLARLARRAFRLSVEARETNGDAAGALALATRWAALDPLEDEAQHTLIAVLARAGNRTAALSAYESYRERLARELEVEPLDDTVRLVERIRAGEAPELSSLWAPRPTASRVEAAEAPAVPPAPDVEDAGPPPAARWSWFPLLQELRGRRIFQVGAAYLAFAALALDVTNNLTERGIIPGWVFPSLLLLLVMGLSLALLLAWVEPDTAPLPSGGWPRWIEDIRGGHVLAVLGALVIGLIIGRVYLTRWVPPSEPIAAAAGLDPSRIAVLYLDDHSENAVNRHLADAFTEALIHELVQVEPLEVLSRNAVRPYRDEDAPLDTIARTLGAGTLVEGSLIGSEDWLRVNVQLINAATLSHLGSIVVQGTRLRPQEVLGSLASQVARELRTALGVEFELRERRSETDSDEAWELVQLGERLADDANSMVMAGDTTAAARAFDQADSLLAAAEALDPEWLQPVVRRGDLAAARARSFSPRPRSYHPEWARRAIEHADRALARARDDPAALELSGRARMYLSQSADSADAAGLIDAAEQDLRAAVRLDPSAAAAWDQLSRVLLQRGRLAEAKLAAERALEADAFLSDARSILFRLCQTSLNLEELAEAQRWCAEGRRRFPERASFVAAELTVLAGPVGPEPDVEHTWKLAAALEELSAPQRRPQLRPVGLLYVAAVLARANLDDSARAVIALAQSADTLHDPQVAYYEANVRLQLGERERAVELLAEFLQALPEERALVASDWWFRPLHDDPRFMELTESSD